MFTVLRNRAVLNNVCLDNTTFELCDSFAQDYCQHNGHDPVCGCYARGKTTHHVVEATKGCITGTGKCSFDCKGKECVPQPQCTSACMSALAIKRPCSVDRTRPMTCPQKLCVFQGIDNRGTGSFTQTCIGCDAGCTCVVESDLQTVASLHCGPKAKCIDSLTGKAIKCKDMKKPNKGHKMQGSDFAFWQVSRWPLCCCWPLVLAFPWLLTTAMLVARKANRKSDSRTTDGRT